MKLSSKIITPLTLGAFLLSAVTGVLLFFGSSRLSGEGSLDFQEKVF